MTAPLRLRVEHLETPLGLLDVQPRLSWQLPPGLPAQTAFQVQAGDWDSGRIESGASVLVAYSGPAVPSRTRVPWRVKAWTEDDELDWSAWSWWETGLPADEWSARWIEADDEPPAPPGQRPAIRFVRPFMLAGRPRAARIYATAHGIYELFVNGVRVGDQELTPGFTSYHHRLQVQAYDVTALLLEGENVIEALVSDGWWRGKTGFTQQPNGYGKHGGLLLEVHVDAGDGLVPAVVTNDRWTWTPSNVIADLMDGQTTGLSPVARDESNGRPVRTSGLDSASLVSEAAPPVRRVREIRPRSVVRIGTDRQVVDLGENTNGWVRLTRTGPPGAEITLVHGEALGPDGDVTMDHLAALEFDLDSMSQRPIPLAQTDRVISGGTEGGPFEPRHTTHGFQYVRVTGAPFDLTPEDITGIVVHTDLRRTGSFRCSDERINALHTAAENSFLTNACDVPTDCPQRERSGWTGDWQVFQPSAAFLFDVAGFSTKWLHDLDADRWPDGRVPNFAPDPGGLRVMDTPIGNHMTGSSGWGDATVIVPWQLWQTYGDRRILEETWDMMTAWVDFAARAAANGRHPARTASRPQPAPHEAFLWDSGFHWGEWLEPGAEEGPDWQADQGHVATAYLHRSALLLSRVAALLGRDAHATQYRELAERARAAWCAEFVDADGRITPDTQATLVRALAFDLIPERLRGQAADRLVELIRSAGTHLGTGFLATPLLLPTLADCGRLDVAYELLFQDTPPSWLSMIDRGATTIWEHWQGIDDHGVPHASLNHYSKGAVISFLHTHVAGIRMLDDEVAYRRFAVQPRPGGGITWATAEHESPYGRIVSEWRAEGGRFHLSVEVPSGCEASVTLPDGSRHTAPPGVSHYESRD